MISSKYRVTKGFKFHAQPQTGAYSCLLMYLLKISSLSSRYYRASVREVKRLYALARSPLYSHFEETVKGVVYIHSDRSTDTAMITGRLGTVW